MSDNATVEERPVQKNRRKNLRNPLPVLRVKVDENRRVFFGYARNISKAGLFITTLNPREIGSRFPVELTLPEPIDQTVECTCEVVWNRNYTRNSDYDPGMGLKFTDLNDAVGEAIEAWVHQEDTVVQKAEGEN